MKSRMKIQEGIDIVADAVGVTLGPRGEFPAHSSSCLPPPAVHPPVHTPQGLTPSLPFPLLRPQRRARRDDWHAPGASPPHKSASPPTNADLQGLGQKRWRVPKQTKRILDRIHSLTTPAFPPPLSSTGHQRRRHHRARHRAPRPRPERGRTAHQGGCRTHQRLRRRRHHHIRRARARDDPTRTPVRHRGR